MNCIWDIVINACFEQEKYAKKELVFKQAASYSPCYEQSLSIINQNTIDSAEIEINALYRFSHIFQELLHPAFLQYPELRVLADYVFDVFIHFLSEIDLLHGLNKREYFVRRIRSEMLLGLYGEQAKLALQIMPNSLQLEIAGEVMSQLQMGSSIEGFKRVVKLIFPECFIYRSKLELKVIYLYVNAEVKEENQIYLNFIKDSFLPLEFNLHEFWKYHFGILDVPETMELNKIAIF